MYDNGYVDVLENENPKHVRYDEKDGIYLYIPGNKRQQSSWGWDPHEAYQKYLLANRYPTQSYVL